MERLGKPQIPLAFEAPGAGKHHGQSAHEEARPARTPNVRVCICGCTEIQKIVFVLPAERPRHVGSALRDIGYRNEGVAGGSGQRPERAQIARGLAFQPGERFPGQARGLGPGRVTRKLCFCCLGHLVQQSSGA